MRKEILDNLICPSCRQSAFVLKDCQSDDIEIRSGKVACQHCQASFNISNGIIDFLQNASDSVLRERSAMDNDDYITDENGNKFKITEEVIQKFKDKFFSFPEGDGSSFFKRGGSFQTIAEASDRFYSAMVDLNLAGSEKVLEIGACFSYASFKFAQKGCSVVAVDISNYLKISDLYVKKAYFERVFSDMHGMPFADNTFDIVFGSAVLHHSRNLKEVFKELKRVLKPGGKLVVINEASRGVLEKVHPVFREMEEKGFADTSYTVLEFKKGARDGGFKKIETIFSSLADDYIRKYENRGGKLTHKVRLAYYFKKHRRFERILLYLTIFPRLLARPKSWKLIAYK